MGPHIRLLAAMAAVLALSEAQAANVVALPSPADAEVPVAIRINGVGQADTVVLRSDTGDWCFTAADLSAWTLRVLDSGIRSHQGQSYHCLSALTGSSARLELATLTLHLTLPASAFEGSAIQLYREPSARRAASASVGAFINYDLLANRIDSGGGSAPWFLSGFAEWVGYTPYGSLESSFLGRNLGDVASAQSQQGRRLARLETFWRQDFPDRLATLTVGDALGASGYWGRPTRFAGLRYASNFETRPGFVTTPQLNFSGEAALPSVVDVFINESRVQSLNVPSGPFELSNLPSFGNVGEARVVVTDVLGRQSLISLPFLTSPRQLRAGLASFSWEAGVARKTFGRAHDDYGGAQAVGQYGYGWTNHLSSELRAEWSDHSRALGLSSSGTLGRLGIVSSTAAFSDSRAGFGSLGVLSYSRPSIKGINWTASAQRASRSFRQLGAATGQAPPQWLLVANAGQRLWQHWNANLGYVRQSYYDRSRVEIVSLSGGTVWRGWGISLSAAARHERTDSQLYSFSLNRSLGRSVRASSSLRAREGADEGSVDGRIQLQKSLPEGPGYGWRLLAGARQQQANETAAASTTERYELGASLRTARASFSADAGRANGVYASRVGVTGAFGLIEAIPFASRSITRSFGIVQAPALAGLPVSVNGQRTAVLDADGYALLPLLIPYASNVISVNLDQAPLDLYVDQPRLELVPGNRTGHLVDFQARRLRAATLRLLSPQGRPLPAGSEIEVLGSAERFVVAENGEAYITSVSAEARLSIRWAGQSCGLSLLLPEGESTAALGTLRCEHEP